MSGLEEIKARAAEPDKVIEWAGNPYADEYVGALQASQADVPKLVALIEKIRDDARADAEGSRATADRLWEQVRTRHPDRNIEDAQRYETYANGARASAIIIDKIIKEGLTE